MKLELIDIKKSFAGKEDYHDAINLKKFVVHEAKPEGSTYESDNQDVGSEAAIHLKSA